MILLPLGIASVLLLCVSKRLAECHKRVEKAGASCRLRRQLSA